VYTFFLQIELNPTIPLEITLLVKFVASYIPFRYYFNGRFLSSNRARLFFLLRLFVEVGY